MTDDGCMQADEAARRYREQSKAESSGQQATPRFEAKDLESLTGRYHTVCCIDVLIHYPPVSLDPSHDGCIDVLPLTACGTLDKHGQAKFFPST